MAKQEFKDREYDRSEALENDRARMERDGWGIARRAEVGAGGKLWVVWMKPAPPVGTAVPLEYLAKGRNGQLLVRADSIVISRRGFGGFVLNPTKGDKEIQIASITAIQLKKPGLTAGYIQFTIGGGNESRGGVFNAMSDENTVAFGGHTEDFERAKALIQERMGAARMPTVVQAVVSPLDELARLAELHKAGVVTDEEFAAKKRQLLGL